MFRYTIISAFAALLGSSSVALATDSVPPSAETARDWTGFYAGAVLNRAIGEYGGEFNVLGTGFPDDRSGELEGGMGGLAIGYNLQRGNVVFGGELAYLGIGNISGAEVCPAPAFSCDFEVEGLTTLTGRVGFLASEDLLVYGSAGFAAASARAFFDPVVITDPGFTDFSGYTLGIGAEYFVSDRMSVRGAVDYHDFGEEPQTPSAPTVVDFSFTTVEVGAFFHF